MLSKFSVKRPHTVIVAVIIVLILGIVAYMGMQVDLLPSIDLPYSVIITSYVGASPEEVETVVTKPLEQSMATVANMKNIMSVSSENSSMIIMEFNQGTDMNAAANEMREKIDLVKPFWDDENIGSPMIVQVNPDMMPIMVASVDVEGMSAEECSAFVDESVLPRLESIEGVASVTAMGMAENRINVTIDEERIDEINEVIAASINGNIGKAKAMLSAARSQIQAAYASLDSAKAEGEAQLNAAQSQIDAGKEALNGSKKELEAAIAGLDRQKTALESEINGLKQEKSSLEQQIKEYTDKGEEPPSDLTSQLSAVEGKIAEKQSALTEIEKQLSAAEGSLAEVNGQMTLLDGQQAEVDKGREELDQQLSDAKSQLDSGMAQVNSQSAKLSSAAASAKKSSDIKAYVTKEMIAGVLMAQNFSMPAGTLDAEEGSFSVKVGDNLKSLEDIGDLFLFELDIDGVDDIRIKDVATVETAAPDGDVYTKVNGNNGILLAFEKQSDYSTSDVSENIAKVMASLEKDNEGLSFYPFMDQGEYVRMIVNSVLENLLIGAALAILILMLCLKDIRPTAIIAVSIPASVLFALVLMYFTGVTMNLISMSGLALGVGMLVDNSIVVIENIYRLRREGMSAIRAAVYGAKQVSGAIVASTLTTISVFIPIAFTNGMSKELFMDMGLTIGFSLIASLIVALTVVPSMASRVLKKGGGKEVTLFAKLNAGYEKLLRKVLNRRKLTIVVICVVLILSVVLSCSRGFSFMPEYDSTELTATLTTEDEDMSTADFYAAADAVTEAALKIDGVEAIGSMSGNAGGSMAMMSGGDTKNIAIYIKLDEKHPAKSDELDQELTAAAEKHGCELEISASTNAMSMLGGLGVQLTVKGDDLSEMSAFTKKLGDDIAAVDGVEEVVSDMETPSSQLMITVDKDAAMKKGLTVAQVYQTVAQEIAADNAATTMTVNGTEYSVFVVDGEEEKPSVDDIADIEVEGQNGKAEVGDIAEISVEDSPSSIYRTNQQRYMTVSVTIAADAVTSSVSDEVEKLVENYDIPDGIIVEVGGETATVSEYMQDLVLAIALALVLMYLIMVAQFQSLRSPFIVMFTVPLAFTGGFLALFIFGFDVSVVALLGFLVLSGVVVNNGIVLVDYVNRLVSEGMELTEALVLGGKTRMRPILMTAMTTVLAMLTMALGIGEGMEMVQPMAVVAIGGLIYATVMTLFFVPVMYDVLHRKGLNRGHRRLSDAAFEAELAEGDTVSGSLEEEKMPKEEEV